MVADEHERARCPRRVQPAGGVGEHEPLRSEGVDEADGEAERTRRVPLVEMRPPLHEDDRPPAHPPEDKPPGVPLDRRARVAGDCLGGDDDGLRDRVGERAQPGAEDEGNLGHGVGAGTDDGDGSGEVGHGG